MKILHIIPTYWPAYSRGGPIWSVHNINKWLVHKGVDVTVYTTDIDLEGKVSLNQEIILDGVKVFYFRHSFPRIWEYWRVGFLPAFLPRHWEYSSDLHKVLQKNAKKFDLVHITSIFLFASTLGVFYAKKFGKPSIISPRGNLMEPIDIKFIKGRFKKIYINFFERQALKNADAIHFTVEYEQKEYESHKFPALKKFIIPNGIDEDEFENFKKDKNINLDFRKKHGMGEDEKIILFLGRLNWKKGLDTLIPAFKLVSEKISKARLVIAGNDEGGYRNKIERLISNYNLEKKVCFTGVIKGEEKIEVFKESDVFVLPSYSENFGMAVVEAMYFGLPVIVTKYVGVAPWIEKSKAGFVVSKDPESIAQAVFKILENKVSQKQMGENGKLVVRQNFIISKIVNQWVEIYKELISKNGLPK